MYTDTRSGPSMMMNGPKAFRTVGVLTAVLMGISIAFAIWSRLGANVSALKWALISIYEPSPELILPEIRGGEAWRLLTPIFVHFNMLHIAFNMLWLKDLGTAIENAVSTRTLLGLTIVGGVLGNLGEYFLGGHILFGGMSGVVYALFGYVWMKAKFDPRSGLRLDRQTVLWMVGWFVLCLTPLLGGRIANYAHGAGLLLGVIWGFISAKVSDGRRGPSWVR